MVGCVFELFMGNEVVFCCEFIVDFFDWLLCEFIDV